MDTAKRPEKKPDGTWTVYREGKKPTVLKRTRIRTGVLVTKDQE